MWQDQRVLAKTYPNSIPAGTPSSERTVWAWLTQLPAPWRVYHHVEWEGERSSRPGDGEADFVLLHPDHGLLILEVKGGGIAVGGKQWYSFDRKGQRHQISDPFEQAKTSKYALIGKIKAAIPGMAFLPAGHAVVFPDLRGAKDLGVNAPQDLVVTHSDLEHPEMVINRITEHWEMKANLTSEEVEAISDLLAPNVQVRTTVRDELVKATAQIDFWTNEQLEALERLALNRRQLIYGTAGTGKTVLAREKAVRLAAEDKTVLLICYNQPLAASIQESLREHQNITVSTFHALCKRLAGRAGSQLRPGGDHKRFKGTFPTSPDRHFWDNEAAQLLTDAADFLGFHVDAVVVDEGQDFEPSWFTALELLQTVSEQGEFYVFADTHQAIYRENWQPPFEGPSYILTKNCRNTLSIAARVAAIFGDKESSLGATGPDPEFIEVANLDGAVRALRKVLDRLLNQGKLDRSQIAILCQRKTDVEVMRGMDFAGHPMSDLKGWGDGVLVETIHRFKGLEADACILFLFDAESAWERALAYIAISRARAQLIVLGSPGVKALIGWP